MSLFSEDLVYQEVSHEAEMEALMDEMRRSPYLIDEMWKTLYHNHKARVGDIAAWWDANNVVKVVIKKIDE